jgi:hypothetical protein
MLDVETRFWELCDLATRHDEAYFRKFTDESVPAEEARASEQAMVEIIRLVEENPEHHPIFVRCFSELALWKRPAPYLLVAFCMRRLRFPEIPELLRRDREAHKGTASYADHVNYWSAIGHACRDKVWENAMCFDFYRHEINAAQARHQSGAASDRPGD